MIISCFVDRSSNGSNGIRKGNMLLMVPGSLLHVQYLLLIELVCPQGYYTEQCQQHRSSAGNCLITPLSLGFYAQVSPGLFQGHFHHPAPAEVREDLCTAQLCISTQQGLWLFLTFHLFNQHPTDGYRCVAHMIPQGSAGGHQHRLVLLPIPLCQGEGLPLSSRILQALAEFGLRCPFLWIGASLPRSPLCRSRIIQGGTKLQPGDKADLLLYCSQQLQYGIAAVGYNNEH